MTDVPGWVALAIVVWGAMLVVILTVLGRSRARWRKIKVGFFAEREMEEGGDSSADTDEG